MSVILNGDDDGKIVILNDNENKNGNEFVNDDHGHDLKKVYYTHNKHTITCKMTYTITKIAPLL
jgi:hypothetical protein